MRHIKLVLAVGVVMIAALMTFAAPAMADRDHNNNRFVSHDIEQEAESGDIDQDFDVSSEGDNSNQTAGIQGVANTGNAQNTIGVIDFGDNFNDFDNDDWWWNGDGFDNDSFEFDEVGSSIELSPTNITSSDQEVNQAAAASAFWPWWRR